MFNLSKIEDNCIIITPNHKKENLIKLINEQLPFFHIKFISKSELIEGNSYSYDYETIYYVHKNYNYRLENAEELLNNLRNIKPINEKLSLLTSIYNDISTKGLITFNKYFKELFNNKKIYIYGYSKIDIELINELNKLNLKYEFLYDNNNKYNHDVYKFEYLEDEVNYVFNKILNLIKDGISLNNIYLYNYSSDYDFLIKKYSFYYNLPIEFNDIQKLYDSPIYKKFLNYINDLGVDKAYKKLKEEIKYDPFDVLGRIVNSITKISYLKLEKNEFIDLLNYIASKTSLKRIKYKESIKIINDKNVISNDDYVFMLGFNLGSFPSVKRDIDFLTDKEKEELNLNTLKIINQMNEDNIIDFCNKTKNLFISYKLKHNRSIYYQSLLVDKLNYKIIEDNIDNNRFSKRLAEIEVAKAKDLLRIYGIDDKIINTYSDKDIHYMLFDHSFSGVNANLADKDLFLSFTQINEYNECPFQYFVKRILKANIFEEKFNTSLGILYHKILEDSITKDVSKEDYNEYIAENFKSAKDLFFLELLLPQVFDVVKKNKEFLNNSEYNIALPEKDIIISIDDKTKLNGKIDKTLISEKLNSYIIVDYKTYGFSFESDKLKYGIDLQLPIYSLLTEKEFPEMFNEGIFIQNVCLNKKQLFDNKEPYKLSGIICDDVKYTTNLDTLLGNEYDEEDKLITESRFIDGLSINSKSKEIKLSKKLSMNQKDYKDLSNIAKEQIEKTVKKIRESKFDISPIKFKQDRNINNKNSLCDRCSCKSICFMNNKDIRFYDLKEAD